MNEALSLCPCADVRTRAAVAAIEVLDRVSDEGPRCTGVADIATALLTHLPMSADALHRLRWNCSLPCGASNGAIDVAFIVGRMMGSGDC